MRLVTFVLLLLLILFAFRRSIRGAFRDLVIVTLAFLGSLVFATIVGREMGGAWGLIGFVIAFIFLVPEIRRLLNQMFPPEDKNRKQDA